MKRQKHFIIIISLLLIAGITFGQAYKTAKINSSANLVKESILKDKNINSLNDQSATAHKPGFSTNNNKATWDILYSFNAAAAGQQAVGTDGSFIYTTEWQGAGAFHKYSMTGTFDSDFTIASAAAIRDFAYDGTYFYGGASAMSLFKMDFSAGTLVSTITATCSGITGIRHCTYDPTLDGGNGGFWIGNWTELGAISMTGSQLIANITGNSDCYGSAYDNWTDPANPRLLLFQQGGSGVEIHGFDINTQTYSGLVHDATDIPGFLAGTSIAGGLESYEESGKFILIGNIQEDPNIIFAYELALTASIDAPDAVVNLTVTPDAAGALTYDITWDNPTLNVGGTALTDITSISFFVDGILETGLTYNLVVGATNTFAGLTVATPGYHTFKVVCTNGSGDGLPFTVTEWIGFIPPANITFNNIEDITADVAWTQVGTPDSWDIEILTTGTPPTGTPTYNTTTNPYGFTGLIASTTYDVYMRADYTGGNSLWVGPFIFTTEPCPVANQCGFVFDYIDDYGDGWNGASINLMQNGVSLGLLTLASGSAGSQTINLCDAASIDLVWTSGAYDEECGFTLTDPFGSIITSFAVGSAPAAGSFFTFTSSCTPPTCPKPTVLTATSITMTSADLGWTNGGSETAWNIEYGPFGFTQGTGTTVVANSNPFTINTLTVGTSYQFYVQADCGGGDLSIWAGPFAFNTACDVISTYPWTDGFESGIACYTITGLPGVETWFLGTLSPLNGVNSAEINYDASLANQDEWLISQVFDLSSLTDPQITFNWNMSYTWGVSPNDNYDMFLKATTDGGSTWTTLWTEPTAFTDWTYYDTTLSLSVFTSETTFQFAFQYLGSDGAAFYLDDITIDNVTSINSVSNEKNVFAYPNPACNILNIANVKNPEVSIYNTIGELVISSRKPSIDVSSLSQGLYVVKVIESNKTYSNLINILK